MVRLGSALCLLAISGLLTVGAVSLPEGLKVKPLSPSQRGYVIRLEITNRKFTPALSDHESKEFRDMYMDVDALLNGVYNCGDSRCPTSSFYAGSQGMIFSTGNAGSVAAYAVVAFNTHSINKVVVRALFLRNAEMASGNLELNMAYTTTDSM